jgi:hypothetical protein
MHASHGVAAVVAPPAAPACTIAVEGPDLPVAIFDELYRAAAKPVVIRNATLNTTAAFRARTTVPALMASYGQSRVTLSSANAFSYGRRRSTLTEYLTEALGPDARAAWEHAAAHGDDDAAAGLFYWFGEHGDELSSLIASYPLPRYTYAAAAPSTAFTAEVGASSTIARAAKAGTAARQQQEPALSFGVGPAGSGVPFHFHNDGFSEVMHGEKHWLLYPNKPPRFQENATSVSWLRNELPALLRSEWPHECTIGPGDLLYFPTGWWHAIINRGDPTVFMSTFL